MHLYESKKSQSGKRRLINLKIHQSENLIDLVIMTEHYSQQDDPGRQKEDEDEALTIKVIVAEW